MASQVTPLALAAGAVAEEGKADPVEDARLAGPGRAVDQEEGLAPKFPEVDHLPIGKWTEGLHLDDERLHAALLSVQPASDSVVSLKTPSAASPISSPSIAR